MKSLVGIFLALSTFCRLQAADSSYEYQFVGHHFIANYTGCDEKALTDFDELSLVLEKACLASGAHILSSSRHIFPPYGMTMTVLLSESHASIHTYPEFRACFIDLFTCGHTCDATKFEAVMEAYLKPESVQKETFLRSDTE